MMKEFPADFRIKKSVFSRLSIADFRINNNFYKPTSESLKFEVVQSSLVSSDWFPRPYNETWNVEVILNECGAVLFHRKEQF